MVAYRGRLREWRLLLFQLLNPITQFSLSRLLCLCLCVHVWGHQEVEFEQGWCLCRLCCVVV